MIKISYDTACNRVTVRGLAGTAPKGEDYICSGVSTLVHTLATDVWCMEQAHLCCDAVADISEGFAEVSCKAVRGYETIVESIFHAVCVGFEMLAEKNPENISFHIDERL